ncbi:MAG: hypothetical protein AAGF11_19250 [Myxococcota bacterium]
MSTAASAFGRLGRRGPVLGVYALAVVLVPFGSSLRDPDGGVKAERSRSSMIARPLRVSERVEGPTEDAVDDASGGRLGDAASAPPERLRILSGVWSRYEPGGHGERVRFYYFHGDGTGLYRYGRVGLTNTHSFDYDLDGDRLILEFRKTAEHHEVPFTLEPGPADERDWLVLHDDPRERGSTRYFRESERTVRTVRTWAEAEATLGPAPAGHMWIDLRPYATGGRGFLMYQLRPAGIDGRGVGWFHRGDFNDWSTEAMTYRIIGDRLELHFSLADERETSAFTVVTDAEGTRWLELADDPRDFWHAHRYADMGPSFGAALAPWAWESTGRVGARAP